MSNQTILERMLEACDRFNAGEIHSDQFAREISCLAANLEAMPKVEIEAGLNKFDHEMWYGCELCYDDEKNEKGWAQIRLAISILREWVAAQLARICVKPPAPNPDTPPESN
jgi:predicted ATPase